VKVGFLLNVLITIPALLAAANCFAPGILNSVIC